MPITTSGFMPRPWRPLTEALFDVAPPDDPEGDDSPEATEWYGLLCGTTALAIHHLVAEVDRNHRLGRGVAIQGAPLGRLLSHQEVLSRVFLDGDPTPSGVGDQLGRLVKTLGFVVYDPKPGPRFRWPMAGREITVQDAREAADRAFHGIYPHPNEKASCRS